MSANPDADTLRCVIHDCDGIVDAVRMATCSKRCAKAVRRMLQGSEAPWAPDLRCVAPECGNSIDPMRAATCSKRCTSRARREAAIAERAVLRAWKMQSRELARGTRGGA